MTIPLIALPYSALNAPVINDNSDIASLAISILIPPKRAFSIRKPSTKYDISPVRPPRKWIPPSALFFSTTPAIVVIISSKEFTGILTISLSSTVVVVAV